MKEGVRMINTSTKRHMRVGTRVIVPLYGLRWGCHTHCAEVVDERGLIPRAPIIGVHGGCCWGRVAVEGTGVATLEAPLH
jgi:hypothetical protein